MRILLAILIVGLSQFICWGQNSKIDPKLLSIDPSLQQNIVIILNEQADISKAFQIKGKNNKAKYVYNTLFDFAVRSQTNIITALRVRGIIHMPRYIVNVISATASIEDIEWIAQRKDVQAIIEDGIFMMEQQIENRREETSGLRAPIWNLTHIGAPAVWDKGITGENTVIGGQDTGYAWEVPTIKEKYRGWNGSAASHDYHWHDAIHEDNPMSHGINLCGFDSPIPCDDHDHGTHTMGTMVGDVDNNGNEIGVSPDAQWIGCRNMENGYGTLTTYTECFEWFLAPYPVGTNPSQGDSDMMPHVITNSWGCPPIEGCNSSNWSVMETALNNLRAAGCVIVVSAGNSGSDCATVNSPAAIFEGSYSVGATNSSNDIANFSSRGAVTVDGSNRLKPDISAPGVNIRSCLKDGSFVNWSGTSMAGPHIAGIVSLMISANPALEGEVDKIQEIINKTATERTTSQNCGSISGGEIPNNTFGHGIANALTALDMVWPPNYGPYVVYEQSIVLAENGKGIILIDRNNQAYKISVSDDGDLVLLNNVQTSSASHVLEASSIWMPSSQTNIILTSSNGQRWKLLIDTEGRLSFDSIGILPIHHLFLNNGDIHIKSGLNGILLKTSSETCFAINVSHNGHLLTIPMGCP